MRQVFTWAVIGGAALSANGVVVDGKTFNAEAFNAALAETGRTAAQLLNCKVVVKYNPNTNKITAIATEMP